ncbi:MAG: Rieske 2Fe-2S domain-containing protein [Chloroflexi bacterium]|nr:Rieske 2Fe-2S domain-containing protein [Chloroflexota bacterium]
MLTREQNELLTHTEPGTPGGELLRRYWQPAALSEELPPGGPPLPIRLFGEDLVLFRDEEGRPGLLGLHCSHRGADLSYGRLEDGGIRCLYHGWLYDREGRCLEQPGEPAGSTFHERIKHPAYPTREAAGVIFAYMGPGGPPLLPAYEFLRVSESQVFSTKYWHDCNYLQANEGNIDPMHLSFLHRLLREGGDFNRANGRPRGGNVSSNELFGRDVAPTLEVEQTDFGVRIFALRDAGNGTRYVRVSNFIYPNLSAFPGGGGGEGYGVNWHVPVDDEHHWKFNITFSRGAPLDRERMRQQHDAEVGPDYHLRRSKANRYLQDRREMQSRSYIGLGPFFPAHDKFAVEGPGPIQDREQEHPGSTDKAIMMARLLLLKGIQDVQQERDPMHVIRTPEANRLGHVGAVDVVLSNDDDWRSVWQRSLPIGEPAPPRA